MKHLINILGKKFYYKIIFPISYFSNQDLIDRYQGK
jgi:hypothetical protein